MKPNNITLSMKKIVENLTIRLDSHFRELNSFVSHPGEIGRAHEHVLRESLKPFIPPRFRIGTGFFIRPTECCSYQQDIMIFENHNTATLFEAGECTVVDFESLASCIEVKTTLKFEQRDGENLLTKTFDKLKWSSIATTTIFSWDGISAENLLSKIWPYFNDSFEELCRKLDVFPLIYVRSKYVLEPNHDGQIQTAPFKLYTINTQCESEQTISDGEALIILLNQIWRGINRHSIDIPCWILQAKSSLKFETVPWPENLQKKIDIRSK